MKIPVIAMMAAFIWSQGALAATDSTVTLEGELIDSFCYLSGVMGGPDATLGTAHHHCALWCAAGGVPVGLLTGDGKVYLVLGEGDDTTSVTAPGLFENQSHRITVEGRAFERDGMNYLIIAKVLKDAGIPNHTYEDYGSIPEAAAPRPAAKP
ncbi:MAG: hypothetical protein Q7N95_09155 [Alphaproteobacteria bacterium]|nr:hypothetical protein [Alphaproteobacteria bacterium]